MRKPLNVLMISHHRRFRIYARSHAMARNLVRRGHKVSLIAVADHRKFGIVESEWDGVRVIETPDLLWGGLRSGWDPWDLANRLYYLHSEDKPYDLIHCFETRPASIYPALFHRRRHPAPLLTDWNDWWGRGGIIDEFRPGWYRTLFGPVETYYEEAFRARADGLTVISTALRDRAIRMGIPPDAICHISGGTFPEQFPFRTVRECRERVGFPMSDPILGFSSMDSHVETETMMRVLSIVAGRFPAVKLLITGKTDRKLVDVARDHGVAAHLHLTGFLPFEDLGWYLGSVNMFILPFPPKVYNIGRWPNKVGDFMSVGRPVISNPVGDIKALLEDHEIGLPAHWEAEDIARKVIRLIEDPAEAGRLGENGRRLAVTKYDWKVLTEALEDFYYEILGRGPGSASLRGGKP